MLPGKCLDEIFAARARQAPDRTAVRAGDRQVSYGELDARADRVATGLAELGVGPGSLVGLCVERGIDLVAGLLGILRAGAAYLPVDPDYPVARIRLLLADSGVGLVVSTARTADRLSGTGATTFCIEGRLSAPVDSRQVPGPARSDGDLAYVIYTSGSTGRPKGVQVEHRNVVRLFEQTEPWFGFGAGDVWALFHSVSFDFSVWEIWGALLHGGCLVVVPAEATRSPARLLELLRAENVTVLNQTPSAFRQLTLVADADPGPALRLVVFGGERLDPAVLRPWVERHGDERPELVNMYGITETTVHVTYRRIRAADLDRPGASPIGVPIGDLTVELLDEQGAPVPPGRAGEMYVSGPGVARGYLGRPELTADRFRAGRAGAVAYRTGDLAVRGADGELDYLGRIDDQLKVRGFRIEPGEVEACLAEHPTLARVIVGSREFAPGDVRLVAYLVPAPPAAGRTDLADGVERFAAARLPAYLRPSAWYVVDDIPVTPEGKADRAALAARAAAGGRGPSTEDGERQSAAVSTVAEIAAEVLERPGVPTDVDLFDLGATSLALVRIIAEVNRRLGVRLTGGELAEAASVSALAACAEAQSRDLTPAV